MYQYKTEIVKVSAKFWSDKATPEDAAILNNEFNEKAGRKRWMGVRPTVRGTVMNPVDHPHGGGEGKNKSAGRHPVSP